LSARTTDRYSLKVLEQRFPFTDVACRRHPEDVT
jgi:hypothetical protein